MIKIKTYATNNKLINKSIITILLLANMVVSSVIAQEHSSTSFGELSINLSKDVRDIIIEENNAAAIPDQYLGNATGKTRAKMLDQQTRYKNTFSAQNNSHNDYAESYVDFVIYGATTLLQDDYDNDGFYQTFSVSFDADIYSYMPNQLGEVYALLYISKSGGPWIHYYTTDDFLIEGHTELDQYEVITTFLSGYPSDHYDILIDLYQVGYGDIVASYSSYDSNALYALPLESADYEQAYVEVIEVSHGGSVSIGLIVLFILIYSIRPLKIKG